MLPDGRFCRFLGLYGVLLLLPAYWLPVTEGTEGRYAEIAREMMSTGNYLEPTLNGIYHFHKPPFAYWGMAAGMELFGASGFGVRFFGIVAALLTVLLVRLTAPIVLGKGEDGIGAELVLASSILFVALSQGVSTDIYLTCCVAGALYFLFRQIYGERSRLNSCGYGFFLGIGFLVKGPVIFLFTLLPYLAAKLVERRHRQVFPAADILLATAIFLMVSLPWYLAVIGRHPELLAYFTKTQTVERVATDHFGRNKPFWFFLALFPATFFPWIMPVVQGAFRIKELDGKIRALYLYLLVPLIVFSWGHSKLPTYILPFYGVAAIIAVAMMRRYGSRGEKAGAVAGLAVLPLALLVAPFVLPALKDLRLPLAAVGIACSAGWFLLACRVEDGRFRALVASYLIVVLVAAAFVGSRPGVIPTGYHRLFASLDRVDPQHQVKTVAFREFLPSLAFYRRSLVYTAFGKDREVVFQLDDSYRRWYLGTAQELRQTIAGEERLLVVARPDTRRDFEQMTGFSCTEVDHFSRLAAFDCRPPAIASLTPVPAPQTSPAVSLVR